MRRCRLALRTGLQQRRATAGLRRLRQGQRTAAGRRLVQLQRPQPVRFLYYHLHNNAVDSWGHCHST